MPAKADDPLRKCTLNLYEVDCAYLETHIGHGWTEAVRGAVHDFVKTLRPPESRHRTLGDLSND